MALERLNAWLDQQIRRHTPVPAPPVLDPVAQHLHSREQTILDTFEARLAARRAALAPPGTAPADALAAVTTDPLNRWTTGRNLGFDDSFRPIATRLTRKFLHPDEQVLAAEEPYTPDGIKVGLVIFTRGYAVRARGREYRVTTLPHDPQPLDAIMLWPAHDVSAVIEPGSPLHDGFVLQAALNRPSTT